jgi:predicted exporter
MQTLLKPRVALVLLLILAGLCAARLLTLDPRAHFTTDVTELLPVGERDPEAQLALSLVRERQARVLLIALDAPASTPAPRLAAAASAHLASLTASPAIAAAFPLADTTWQHELGRRIHSRRFDLLLPGWLAEQRRVHASEQNPAPFPQWLANRAVAALDAHLASPASAATAELLPSDPLLLLYNLAERSASLAVTPHATPARVLIWAESREGPLTEGGQEPVFAALAAAEAAAQAEVSGLTARFTGVARFAAAAKASTRAEIGQLNIYAIIGVLLVSALFIRRLPGLLHLLPCMLFATLGAVSVTTLVFPRIHVLVFVLGSLLSGVAVDYGFYVTLARRENEPYPARLRRLALPLLGGAFTTVAGFLVLTFSELPLVRQLGVYVAAGIVTGLAVTALYFSLFPRLDLAPRHLPLRAQLPARWRSPLLIALGMVAVIGLTRIHWLDDLRTLEYPSPHLRTADAALRAAFGETDTGSTLLTRGSTYAEARQRWQNLADTQAPHALGSVALLLPTTADFTAASTSAARGELTAFAAAFHQSRDTAGFEPGAFTSFDRDFAAYIESAPPAYETLAHETLSTLPGPLGLLTHADAEGIWLLSTLAHGAAPTTLTEGTLSLSGLGSLNHLFARYRQAATRLSLLSCAALIAVACSLHGLRAGLRTAALPLLAAALAFGLLALRGDSFGLFHLLGALLGVCLADDYAHFSNSEEGGSAQASTAIRLSGLSTAASFAVLMLSAIPAVAALGTTVTLIVALALIFVETNLFSLRSDA